MRASTERHATPATDKGTLFAEGGEHHVYYRPGDDFITKATHSGKYGQVLDQMGPDEDYRFNLRPASPSEYLTRIALTRVMLHERVGHDGLGLLLNAPGDRPGKPNLNRLRWENLVRGMPHHLLEAIGSQPGYEHLKGNQEALALEWFAREAEARPELLTQPSLVMRMWDNFKQGVADLMARLGLDPLKGRELDAQVMALLQRARQAVRPGGRR